MSAAGHELGLQLALLASSLVANLVSALAGGGAGPVQLPVLILLGPFWNGTGALTLGLQGQIAWRWLPMLLAGSISGGHLGAHLAIVNGSRLVKRALEILAQAMGGRCWPGRSEANAF